MRINKFVYALGVGVFFLLNTPLAFAISFAEFAYKKAETGDVASIYSYMQKGYHVDAMRSDGATALCLSVVRNNYEAYRRLRELGADSKHQCMDNVNQWQRQNFENKYTKSIVHNNEYEGSSAKIGAKDNSWLYTGAGFAAVAGAAVAIATHEGGKSSRSMNKGFLPDTTICYGEAELVDGVCVCPNDLIYDKKGCRCPDGTRLEGGSCQEFTCDDSLGLVVAGNECACRSGMKWTGEKCEIVCPPNTKLVGRSCIAIKNLVVEDYSGGNDDVYMIKAAQGKDNANVFNVYSAFAPEYNTDGNTAVLKHTGTGDAYGVFGKSNVFNTFVDGEDGAEKINPSMPAVGRIIIENKGSGDVYGMYSKVDNVNDYREVVNSYSQDNGIAKGYIDITNQGGGTVYGIMGDIRAYNAYAVNGGGDSYGSIKIKSDGDIYGLSGYVATTNAVAPLWNASHVRGDIDIESVGNGDVYGIMVNKDNIPGAGGYEENNLAQWFAFNAYSDLGARVEGNVNIYNGGNGNVYGMYGGQQLYNARSYGDIDTATGEKSSSAKGVIDIVNIGSGDVYGMYMPENDFSGHITNETDDKNLEKGAHSLIKLVNIGNGTTYGMRGSIGNLIENSGTIDINRVGGGVAYGILGGDASRITSIGDISIYSEQFDDSKSGTTYTPETSYASVYGVKAGMASSINNSKENLIKTMEYNVDIEQVGAGDVYGILSGGNVSHSVLKSHWDYVLLENTDDDNEDDDNEDDDNEDDDNEEEENEEPQYIPVADSRLVDGKFTSNINIDNQGDGNVYGIKADGDIVSASYQRDDAIVDSETVLSPIGQVISNINIVNIGDGQVYGMYQSGNNGGKVYNFSDEVATSSINIVNKGDGVATGIRGSKGADIINMGDITINNLGNGTAIGIYAEENASVLNKGTITIRREAIEGINPVSALGGTAYGIYAESGVTVDNDGGTIIISGAQNGSGIYLEQGATLINRGIIQVGALNEVTNEGEVLDIYGDNRNRSLNVASLGKGELLLGKNGKLVADGISGDIGVSQDVVQRYFSDKYILTNALLADKVDDVALYSKSIMFKTAKERSKNGEGYDVVLSRRNFANLLENQNIALYLENNYQLENGAEIYDYFKMAGTLTELNAKTAEVTGENLLPNFRYEDLIVYRNLSRQFNDNLFNKPHENYIGGYKYIDISSDKDGAIMGNDGSAHAAYGMLKGTTDNNVVYGVGATVYQLDSDYDNGSKRKSNSFGIWAPIGKDFGNGLKWFSKAYLGYSDNSYKRFSHLGRYSASYKEYQYGLSNEARYSVLLGRGVNLEPVIELNLLGAYRDDFNEGNMIGAIKADSDDYLSVEGGLGAYLTREFMFNDESKFGIQIGGVYYVEFSNPDEAKFGLRGFNGRYSLVNKSEHGRGILSARLGYTYKDITLYGAIEKELGKNNTLTIDAGVQYKF